MQHAFVVLIVTEQAISTHQAIIFFVAMLGAIGAPGIPSVGMLSMVLVLESVGLPTAAIAILLLAVAGCGGGKAEIQEDRLTVGKVQGEIKVGMADSQVAELLGSPNIVTTDDQRREVWVYDKIASEVVRSSSGLSISPLGLLTGGSGIAMGLPANLGFRKGAAEDLE